jgi:saccharopine dehydrogenase (NADP+, L-glutamate forming)
MIVMQHQFTYKIDRQIYQTTSSLVQIGKPQYQTAMAKTVGLPLAIATSLLLEEKIHLTGLHIPTHPAIYKPALARLAQMEVVFQEETTLIQM